ncbi:hypothetical protein EDD11_010581, partial [Mortierella claussenii]
SEKSTLEKAAEVDEFAQAGREKGESYKSYYYRLNRLIEVYKVKELPKHADVTQTLRMSVPSLTLTVMEIAEVQQQMLKFIGMLMPDVTTLDFLMKAIPQVHGPDDTPEWKTVIEAAKKKKNAKEQEEQRQSQQAKDKMQKKSGGSDHSKNVSLDANTAPKEARSGQHNVGRGGFGNGSFRGHNKTWTRGGGRGGRGHPYHNNEGQGEYDVDDDESQTVADNSGEDEVLKYHSLRQIPVQAEIGPTLEPKENLEEKSNTA